MEREIEQDVQELRQELAQLRRQLNDQDALVPDHGDPQAGVAFAFSPASINHNFIIDYSTTQGMKIHKQATEALPIKHDLDQEKLNLFLESLASHAFMQGWDTELMIINQDGQDLKLTDYYGTINQEAVKNKVLTYAFQDTRNAQDSSNLFQCLEHSLTDDALNTVHAEKESYTITRRDVPQANERGHPTDTFKDGLLFLWTIINRTTARTNATISVIIDKLTNLPSLMSDMQK